MYKSDLVESFIHKVNPYTAWESIFGCLPGDTDISEGVNSCAASALEQALENLDSKIDTSTFGAPFNISFEKNRYNINHIRKKLMSAVILDAAQKKSSQTALEYEHDEDGMGVIGVLGDITNTIPLLEALGVEGLSNIISSTDCSYNQSPVYLTSGNPAIEVELNTKKMIQGVVGLILNEHLREIILRKKVDEIDFGVTTSSLDVSPYLSFADEEDRYRVNEILKCVQRSIDEGENDIENLIRFAPYRATLIQNMTLRIIDDLAKELENYGFQKISETKFACSFAQVADIKPAVYRLLGDIQYRSLGLVRREVIKRMTIRMPFLSGEGPSIALIQPDEISMRTFTELSGGADAYIILPEATAGSEDLLEMEDGIILDEDSIHNTTAIKQTILDIFPEITFLTDTKDAL